MLLIVTHVYLNTSPRCIRITTDHAIMTYKRFITINSGLYLPEFYTNWLWFPRNLCRAQRGSSRRSRRWRRHGTEKSAEPSLLSHCAPSIPPLKHGPGERRASRRELHWHSQILCFPQKLPLRPLSPPGCELLPSSNPSRAVAFSASACAFPRTASYPNSRRRKYGPVQLTRDVKNFFFLFLRLW